MLTMTVTAINVPSYFADERTPLKSLLLLTLALAPAVGFQPAALAGTWNVIANVGGNQGEQTCTFTQKDSGWLATAEPAGACPGDRQSRWQVGHLAVRDRYKASG